MYSKQADVKTPAMSSHLEILTLKISIGAWTLVSGVKLVVYILFSYVNWGPEWLNELGSWIT